MTFEVGDRVRYRGMHMTGAVQSVWPPEATGDPTADTQYVVQWLNGQTTTVPQSYLLPERQSRTEMVVVVALLVVVMIIGLLVPLLGWFLVTLPAALTLAAYWKTYQSRRGGRR